MQGLADLKNNFGKYKKRIYSVTLMVLLVFSGLMGAFITFKNTSVYASSYTYTEDFDDDTTGTVNSSNPSESWYTMGFARRTISGNTYLWGDAYGVTNNISTATYVSSPKSFYHCRNTTTTSYDYYNCFNLSSPSQIDYFNMSIYLYQAVTNGDSFYLHFMPDGASLINGSSPWGYEYVTRIRLVIDSDTNPGLNIVENGSYTNLLPAAGIGQSTWMWLNLSFNWANSLINISFYNGTGIHNFNGYWFDNHTCNGTNISHIMINDVSNWRSVAFIDNIKIGSPTQIGGGGGSYPYINGTAFNASLPTTISGNHSVTFDNDSGSPCWSNSSGTTNEIMNITIVDGNASVTFVNISMFNLSDGSGHYINADKIYLYIYNASAVSWVNKSNFPTNGGNISLDNTDTDIGVTWPISGNQTILCRFKLIIPGGTTEAVYTQTTLCGVYIGG